ncbi:MAG: PGF-pre-PGF domain-containing protein, partial [Methanosarcina sp.]|nr:PGF-pre-PGF domain-containing protein [Methanosarcina sp.]
NKSSNYSDSSSSSRRSSSRGLGMDVLSSESASNIAAKELVTRSVISGYPVRFDFIEDVTCITYIEFDPKKTFRRTTTIVEELKNRSTLVPTSPSGTVYKHVNVWVGDKGAGLPTSIRSGLIEFRVEKSWIKDENINKSLITLQRYDEDWQPLYTEIAREDNNYIYFKAKTPGYSFFAITEYTGQSGNEEENRGITLGGLGGNIEKGSRIKNPMGTARIFMAVSLPLFMILVGYCLFKKKI